MGHARPLAGRKDASPSASKQSDHPLSPHSLPILHGSNPRRSPSLFAAPLPEEAVSSSYFGASTSRGRREPDAIPLGEGSSRNSPRRDGVRKEGQGYGFESLGRDEAEIARRRYDLMDDEQIREVLVQWERLELGEGVGSDKGALADQTNGTSSAVPIPKPIATASGESVNRAEILANVEGSSPPSPLFPPSPPSRDLGHSHPQADGTGRIDHPLRVLARAVLELQDTVERLRKENEALRGEIAIGGRTIRGRDGASRGAAERISLHDGLNEAISTSLTSIPTFSAAATHPGRLPDPPRVPSPAPSSISRRRSPPPYGPAPSARSIRSVDVRPPESILPSSRSMRSFDSRQADAVLPSNRSARSVDVGDTSASPKGASGGRKRDAARSSWTASLWGWGGAGSIRKGTGRDRRGSVSSSLREEVRIGQEAGTAEETDEDDEHAWRRGDGGSAPAFRAVFLATRIVTPDPSSILSSPHIAPNSLIAYLAHSLVSHARDQCIVARDPPNTRRRPSRETRSRAASIMSQDSGTIAQADSASGSGREKSYGETLAATALYGRSLLSSVSGATLRGGGKSRPASTSGYADDTIRPSLLNRTSARQSPTTALSSSGTADMSATSIDEVPLPSVEMASIIAGENQPPTVLLSRQNLGLYFQGGKKRVQTATRFKGAEPPLTDRYGFIYDIQHASMLKDASAAGVPAPASLSGVIPGVEEGEGWIERRRRESADARPDLKTGRSGGSVTSSPSPSAVRVELPSTESSGRSTPTRTGSTSRLPTTDPRHRSSTIASLNPSPARPVIAKDTLTVSARGASSLRSVASPHTSPLPDISSHTASVPSVSRATVSSLLDQLTELHDRQQAERKVEWDAWLAKRKRKLNKGKGETGTSWGGDLIGISQMGLGDAEEWRVFARLVRHGIPLAYRADVWAECSGAKDALVPGEYREILAVHATDVSPVLAEIEKDVSRTFPGNMFFGGDGPGVDKLRRVLVAYSWRNPRVGYCQGMNMLAATLLLTHTDEEQAFWVLSAMIDRLLPTDFYAPSLLASRTDQAVLAELVQVHLPRVASTLEELGVDLASITFGWFLSLFTDCLPVETLFRVWDVFFVEGHDTLFRVALAILKLNEAEICAAESAGELFAYVAGMTGRLWAADKLISTQHGYRPLLRHTDIASRYARHLSILQEA